jgi:hypothetical protein
MRSYYVPGAWNVTCDRCGLTFKSYMLKEEWTGLMVCTKCFERRHPQTLMRLPKDDPHVPWSRPASGPNVSAPDGSSTQGLGPNESYITQPNDTLTLLNWHQVPIDRFTLKYFRANGPRTTSFALTSTDTTLSMDFLVHQTNDLIGLIWESQDTKDHLLLSYDTDKDYRDVTWAFDIELSSTMPVLNDPTQAISITVRGRDQLGAAVDYFIPIFRYCDNPTGRTARVSIDFSTVKSGFFADTTVFAGDVDEIFISAVATGYSPSSSAPLGSPIQGYLRISNQVVGGSGAKIMQNRMTINRHTLGMSTSYDDHYDVSPQRILENIDTLGFAKYINHYCGMSIFPYTKYDGAALRYLVVLPTSAGGVDPVINPCAKLWHQNYAALLQAGGWSTVWSVSYETFSENARTDWVQKDWNDNIGFTSYTPPSYLLTPGSDNAMAWLKQSFVEFATIMNAASLPVKMQVGEPWWWYQPSTQKPCIYDFDTRVKFNAATGLFMADFGTISSTLSGSPYDQMKTFCRDLLGQSVLDIRTAVRAAFPSATVSALIFLPTIIGYGIMETINLPVAKYSSPNLDFFQTEAYDWIINNQMSLTSQAMTYPHTTLGYAYNNIEYLAGFAPNGENSSPTRGAVTYEDANKREIWRRIVGNIKNNIDNYNPSRQYIWAYTIVMRDSVTFINNNYDKFFYYLLQLTPQRT